MDMSEGNKSDENSQNKLDTSEVVEVFATKSANSSQDVDDSNSPNALQLNQNVSESLMKQNESEDFVTLKTKHLEVPVTGDVLVNDQILVENLENATVSSFLNPDNYIKCEQYETDNKESESQIEAMIKVVKPLCADYKSDSDSESVDSESDSSITSTSCTTAETSSESEDDDNSHDSSFSKKATTISHEKKSKSDLMLLNLPPIEDLRISVPEEACVDIGTITNIVDVLVVVESYKGTAALDLDTVLFLDRGKRTLGKVFDILGPITEPVYTIRFNSQEQINNWNIKKGLKVYFAPKTEHTNFVFMTEVLKNRGTDASWKDNAEAPPEFQDFSDDEEEKLHRSKQTKNSNELSSDLKSRKRSFSEVKQTSGVSQPSRFRNPGFPQRISNFQRNSSSSPRPNVSSFTQAVPFPYNPAIFPPNVYFFPRFSGPPLRSFEGPPFMNQNFRRPFFHQRGPVFHQTFELWGRSVFRPVFPSGLPPPPPPPPPLVEESDRQFASQEYP